MCILDITSCTSTCCRYLHMDQKQGIIVGTESHYTEQWNELVSMTFLHWSCTFTIVTFTLHMFCKILL